MKYNKNYIIQYLRILENNIIWIIHNKKKCIIVDPGCSYEIIKKLKNKKIKPKLIFVTHNHEDHIKGIKNILYNYPKTKIITSKKIFLYTNTFFKNQILIKKNTYYFFDNNIIKIFFSPGHTKSDLSYYLKPFLFCGDLIFHGGCGNVKDGSINLLFNSFKKISKFPEKTIFLYGHEYSLKNLQFLKFFFKKNFYIQEYFSYIKNKNSKYQIITNSLKFEQKINIFLKILRFNKINNIKFKISEYEIKKCLNYYWDNFEQENNLKIFKKFRMLKDQF